VCEATSGKVDHGPVVVNDVYRLWPLRHINYVYLSLYLIILYKFYYCTINSTAQRGE